MLAFLFLTLSLLSLMTNNIDLDRFSYSTFTHLPFSHGFQSRRTLLRCPFSLIVWELNFSLLFENPLLAQWAEVARVSSRLLPVAIRSEKIMQSYCAISWCLLSLQVHRLLLDIFAGVLIKQVSKALLICIPLGAHIVKRLTESDEPLKRSEQRVKKTTATE